MHHNWIQDSRFRVASYSYIYCTCTHTLVHNMHTAIPYLGVSSLLEKGVRSMTPPSVLQTHVSSLPGAASHRVPDGSPAASRVTSSNTSSASTYRIPRPTFIIEIAAPYVLIFRSSQVMVGGSRVHNNNYYEKHVDIDIKTKLPLARLDTININEKLTHTLLYFETGCTS